MTDIFISYARSTEAVAQRVAEAFRALGFTVWRDDQLPANRSYADVIEERHREAKAVVVIWSADATRSDWVRSEADRARGERKLVQARIDGAVLPMPFDQIQCADLGDWSGEAGAAGWRKVVSAVAEVLGRAPPSEGRMAEAAPFIHLDRASIAVLPLADLTPARDEDYFADGMVEEIATALSRFASLFVIDSRSSLTYRASGKPARQIARELGVRYVLEGSVRRSGSRIRVGLQLIDAVEGVQIWAETFDGAAEDLFAFQDAVAGAIATQIEPTIEAAEMRRVRAKPTEDLRAYELLLHAQHAQRQWKDSSLGEAIGFLERAIALDPDYALAKALASYCYALLAIGGLDTMVSAMKSIELARAVLHEADPDARTLAWSSTAFTFFMQDWATSLDLTERAVARTPGSALSRLSRGWVYLFAGRLDAALDDFETVLRLDPRSPDRQTGVVGHAWTLFFLRRLDEAIPALVAASQLGPAAIMLLAAAHAHQGRIEEARRQLGSLPDWPFAQWVQLFREPEHREYLVEGLRLAGAEIAP